MAADINTNGVRLQGFDDLAAKLRAIVPALRKKALRNALAAGARVVRDDARRAAPVLQKINNPYRAPGTVRNAISVRTSKAASRAGDVGVFVNVRPAKGAKFKTKTTRVLGLRFKSRVQTRASQRGAKSKTDPFYWRFLEFGTRKMSKKPFLQPAAKRLPQALEVFTASLGKWFERTNRTAKVQP